MASQWSCLRWRRTCAMMWLIQMCDTNSRHVWHISNFICDHCQRTPRTRTCAMTWFIHQCDKTSWHVWHVQFHIWLFFQRIPRTRTCSVTWLIHMCDVISWLVWHISNFICDHCQRTPRTRLCAMTWPIQVCVRHDSVHNYDVTHSHMCHTSPSHVSHLYIVTHFMTNSNEHSYVLRCLINTHSFYTFGCDLYLVALLWKSDLYLVALLWKSDLYLVALLWKINTHLFYIYDSI